MSITELVNKLNGFNINNTFLDSNNTFLDSKNKEVKSHAVCTRMQQWISKCPYHTFPKSKKAWINTIRSQKNLRMFIYKIRPYKVLDDIMYNKPVAKMLESHYNQIRFVINNSKYQLIKKNYMRLAKKIKKFCNVYVHFNIDSVYNYMIDKSIIIKRKNTTYYRDVDIFINSTYLPIDRHSLRIFYYKNKYSDDIEDLEKYEEEKNEVDKLFKKMKLF